MAACAHPGRIPRLPVSSPSASTSTTTLRWRPRSPSILAAEGRIDLLVNNAGVALVGSIEETAIDQARALFETDFFGLARLTQLVLPAMRAAGRGRIVNIGSVMGLIPAAFMGYYSAVKHAIEGYTESLDHEVRPFGVRAIVIEPGFMRTRFGAAAAAAGGRIEAYRAARGNAERTIGAYRRAAVATPGWSPPRWCGPPGPGRRGSATRSGCRGGRSRCSGASRRPAHSTRSFGGSSSSTADRRNLTAPRASVGSSQSRSPVIARCSFEPAPNSSFRASAA